MDRHVDTATCRNGSKIQIVLGKTKKIIEEKDLAMLKHPAHAKMARAAGLEVFELPSFYYINGKVTDEDVGFNNKLYTVYWAAELLDCFTPIPNRQKVLNKCMIDESFKKRLISLLSLATTKSDRSRIVNSLVKSC
jgi:hypothetical protein